MVEATYVLCFERVLGGRALPLAGVPWLERVRLVAALPREGDAVPGVPDDLVSASVVRLDESTRPGVRVIWCRARLPMRTADDVGPALTLGEQRWLRARIAEAERLGWRQVEPEEAGQGARAGDAPPAGVAAAVSRRPLLPLDQIRDDVIVQFSGRDDQGGYLVLKAGEELLEEIVEPGAVPPARGTRGRIARGRFLVYADQSLRRVPHLDHGDQLGWMSLARPDGFTAPREIVPGADTPADP